MRAGRVQRRPAIQLLAVCLGDDKRYLPKSKRLPKRAFGDFDAPSVNEHAVAAAEVSNLDMPSRDAKLGVPTRNGRMRHNQVAPHRAAANKAAIADDKARHRQASRLVQKRQHAIHPRRFVESGVRHDTIAYLGHWFKYFSAENLVCWDDAHQATKETDHAAPPARVDYAPAAESALDNVYLNDEIGD